MKILIVAATQRDVKYLIEDLEFVHSIEPHFNNYKYENLNIDILITGTGSAFITYHLTKTLSIINYDLAVNIGLAGSYDYFLEQGFVVNVIQDEFADIGFEDDETFHTGVEMELMDENQFPFNRGKLISMGSYELLEIETLIPVKSVTINTISGKKEKIDAIRKKFNPDIETQDGAAFNYVCLMEKIPYLQLRAISHYVELRNIENWNIPYAYKALKETVLSLLDELNTK